MNYVSPVSPKDLTLNQHADALIRQYKPQYDDCIQQLEKVLQDVKMRGYREKPQQLDVRDYKYRGVQVGEPGSLAGVVTLIRNPAKVFKPELAQKIGQGVAYFVALLVSLTVVGFFALLAENSRQKLEEATNQTLRGYHAPVLALVEEINRELDEPKLPVVG